MLTTKSRNGSERHGAKQAGDGSPALVGHHCTAGTRAMVPFLILQLRRFFCILIRCQSVPGIL